ncbi:MAG: DM13 domain-containing protein [Actinobacteria bacterium]|nr:DM13 domain-containing protein [Actinomycetota bacterium]
MEGIGRSFIAHPARLAGALLTLAALSVIVWYLASPLFVRTYVNEAPPSAIAVIATATGGTQPTAVTTAGGQETPRVVASGELGYVDSLHNGKGPVRIVEAGAQHFVRFEDVTLTNAPDVHVYLSLETGGRWSEATSLYLGPLKATNGSFNYELPPTADVGSYQSVVVWCRAFRVLISWADFRAT